MRETILELKLLVKGVKSTVFNMLKELKGIMDKEPQETSRMLHEQIGNINKEIRG